MNAISIAMIVSCFFTAAHPVYAATVPSTPPEIQVKSHKIDINHADVSELIGSFKGIGKKRAESIIAYRDSHHGFKSIEELGEVKGFGPNFIQQNRERLNTLFVINN